MTTVCDICGIEFQQTYRKEKRCSQECRCKSKNRKGHIRAAEKKKKQIAARNALPQTCQRCGQSFIWNRKKKYCSQSCMMNPPLRECGSCAKPLNWSSFDKCQSCRKMEKTYLEQTTDFFLELSNCRECKKLFVIKGRRQVFCSHNCYRRNDKRKWASKYRRRCRKYGVAYDSSLTLISALNYFGYVCAICNEMILGNQRDSTDPNQAVLDHIIPLAMREQSPGHVWSNVQVVHRHCNNRKAHTSDMELISKRRRTHT